MRGKKALWMERTYVDYVVNAEEMQRADENTISCFGVPQLVLMERAALAARDFMVQRWPGLFARSARILFALGNGNNGGDGAALARLFYLQGHRVTVLVSGRQEKYSSALQKQMEILERYRGADARGDISLSILTDEEWSRKKSLCEKSWDLVVDALFGIGLSRQIDGICRDKIAWLNGLPGKKAALDIPSGVSARDGRVLGLSFRADLTVTFGFFKTGMLLYPGRELCGECRVADIGITRESFLKEDPAGITVGKDFSPVKVPLFRRRKDGHKGSFGKVLLVAGSVEAPGAALLAGEAVLRSGAGMLRIVSCGENRELILTKLPEAMYQELGSGTDWEKMLGWCDAVVVGPGIGVGDLAKESLKKIVDLLGEKYRDRPLVLDADGLNLVAGSKALSREIRAYVASGGTAIMTPHMAELARLMHCKVGELQAERMERVRQFAEENGGILVSKDAATIVCHMDETEGFRYYINQTGNSGMATAGSGDVLSGVVGAFAAFTAVQRKEQGEVLPARRAYFEAAYRAVYAHGAAGDRAAEKFGEVSMKAGDMIRMLSELFAESNTPRE